MKSLIFAALVGVAVAMPYPDQPDPYKAPVVYKPAPEPSYKPVPQPYKPAPKPYSAPAPAYHKPSYKEPEYPPQPYEFKYGVADEYTGTAYQAAEAQDAAGAVIGSYTVNLPDGRVQTVTYRADHAGGFVADVSYEGEAVYPPEPAEGYGNSYKAKHNPGYKAPHPAKYAPAAPKYVPAPAKYDN